MNGFNTLSYKKIEVFLSLPHYVVFHRGLGNVTVYGSGVFHRNSTVARRVTNVTSEHYGSP